jgi:energy-coupling factor transport system permease protein
MLKDITLGQFFPGKSVVHKLDPRTKLVGVLIYIIVLFMIKSYWGYVLMGAFLAAVIVISKIPFKMVVKSIKPILLIIVLTAILNIFYTSGDVVNIAGHALQWGWFKITWQGLTMAAFMVVRLVFLLVGTSMLTYTTSPIMLTDAIENLLRPLKKFKLPVHELAMMMTIALRFIPLLIEETDKIMSAQKARGADFETGSLMQRAKALIPILVPLFISAFRRSDELAVAMECRCYHGDDHRTRLKQLKMSGRDYGAYVVLIGVCVLSVAFNYLGLGVIL